MGSQCNVWSAELTWSRGDKPRTSRAAAFCTRWRGAMVDQAAKVPRVKEKGYARLVKQSFIAYVISLSQLWHIHQQHTTLEQYFDVYLREKTSSYCGVSGSQVTLCIWAQRASISTDCSNTGPANWHHQTTHIIIITHNTTASITLSNVVLLTCMTVGLIQTQYDMTLKS